MPSPRSLDAVIKRHLTGPRRASVRRSLDPQERRLLLALGLAPERDGPEAREVLEALAVAARAGVDDDTLFSVCQAYGRAVGPIVDAEVELVRFLAAETPRKDRPEALDAFLASTVPLTTRLFDATHRARLLAGLADALLPSPRREVRTPVRAIAVVDIVGSTLLVESGDVKTTEDLVDSLLEAGQSVAATHPVTVVKYVGDGVILVGRDPSATAVAALAVQDALAQHSPAIGTHAGLAIGPVLRRAGDYFGFAVNLAHRLAEAAGPGDLLAQEGAVDSLPDGVERSMATVELRGLRATDCEVIRRRGDVSPRATASSPSDTRRATARRRS